MMSDRFPSQSYYSTRQSKLVAPFKYSGIQIRWIAAINPWLLAQVEVICNVVDMT
jgi:hypothetical protein